MKRTFSLLFFCCAITIFAFLLYTANSDAQQHDSLADAGKLSLNCSVSTQIPAYSSKYFYFLIPSSAHYSISKLSLLLSADFPFKLHLCDSKGFSLSLQKTRKKQFFFYQCEKTLHTNERYFIQIENITNRKRACHFKLMIPKNIPVPSSAKSKHTPKPAKTHIPLKQPTKPTPPHSKLLKPTKPASNYSKSMPSLKTHFLRIKVGCSLALIEKISNTTGFHFKLKSTSPDILSIQNGIIYGRQCGIAIVLIHIGSKTTSCTIKVEK